jgi:7-cyano-7-deazaguanine reductase
MPYRPVFRTFIPLQFSGLPGTPSERIKIVAQKKKSLPTDASSLKTSTPYGAQAIRNNILERWPNPETGQRYRVNFSFPEFTCLCPRSGYPDFATIRIEYIPRNFIVELKSLKLYLNGFRQEAHSHEGATNRIFRDLSALLEPQFMEVVGDFNVRGNLKTVVTVNTELNPVREKDGPAHRSKK